ncbi:hypothetical protein D3248_06010 [Leucobacter zeae]|nr:hypothetical protein [Leucobacter zeae]
MHDEMREEREGPVARVGDRSGFRPGSVAYLTIGLGLHVLAFAPWLGLTAVEQGSGIAFALTIAAIVLHAAAAAFLLVAMSLGIRNLVLGVRPRAPEVLAVLSIPIAGALLVPMLIVLYAVATGGDRAG